MSIALACLFWAEIEPAGGKVDIRTAMLKAVDGPLTAICQDAKDVLRLGKSSTEQCSKVDAKGGGYC